MNPSLMTAWLVEVVVISYRSIKNGGKVTVADSNAQGGMRQANTALPLPLPSTYLSTFIIFGTLGLVPGEGRRVASAIGWGFVVATLLNLWHPGKANQKPTVSQTASNQATTRNRDTGVSQIGA